MQKMEAEATGATFQGEVQDVEAGFSVEVLTQIRGIIWQSGRLESFAL